MQQLVIDLTTTQQSLLGDLFGLISHFAREGIKFSLPTSLADFRRLYTEGPNTFSYCVKKNINVKK